MKQPFYLVVAYFSPSLDMREIKELYEELEKMVMFSIKNRVRLKRVVEKKLIDIWREKMLKHTFV